MAFGLKRQMPRGFRSLDNFIFIFKHVPRQQDSSRVNGKETGIISTAHAETVTINSGRPCSVFARFLVDELRADRAISIDIELFQVRRNVSYRPTRRKNG